MFTAMISFPVSLIAYKKVMKDAKLDWKIKDIFDWGPKDKSLFNKIIKFNLLFAVANILFALMTTSMFIQFGELLNIFSINERVTYRVMVAIASIFWFLFHIVNPVTQAISESHGMRNKVLTHNYFKCVVKFPLMLGVGLFGFYIFAGKEIIASLYHEAYVTMGVFMIIAFFPGLAFATFAEKYDNMLAGVGRPDIPMMAWLIGFLIAILGLIISIFLPEIFLVDSWHQITTQNGEELQNWGLTLKFAVAILGQGIGLLFSGIVIIRMTIKVFNIKIPRSYLTRPLLAISTPMIINIILDTFFGFNGIFGPQNAILVKGLFLFLGWMVLMIIFGGISVYDARFLRNIIKNIPGGVIVIAFLTPIYRISAKLRILQPDETSWITAEESANLKDEQEFKIDLNIGNDSGKIVLTASDFKQELYDIVSYLKVDDILVEDSIKYWEKWEIGKEDSMEFNIDIGEHSNPDLVKAKVQVIFEGFEQYATNNPPISLIKRKIRFRNVDFRMIWNYEKTLLFDKENETYSEE